MTQLVLFPELEGEDDWTFARANTRDLTHCYHDYPARMIPQVARRLLRQYGAAGGLLFDPYCGTGTSLVEGRLAGMDVVGTDLNPLARLIARTKASVVCVAEVEAATARLEAHLRLPVGEAPGSLAGVARLEFWFSPSVAARLAHIGVWIATLEDGDVRRFFEVAWSETVRESSNTRNHEFKLYRMSEADLERFTPDVFGLMRAKVRRNVLGLREFAAQMALLPRVGELRVYDFNSVAGIPGAALEDGAVDLVLTSPPYGDSATTVAYGQYSRLSSAWLGFTELEGVDRTLMGGRARPVGRRFASGALETAIAAIEASDAKRAGEVAAFYGDLEDSIQHVAAKVRVGGHACYVVGNRRVKGVELPTDDAVRCAFESQGFVWRATHVRAIPGKRMPAQNSPSNVVGALEATMSREFVVVMERVGRCK